MRLTRFTVNQVKQFRQPLTIADLTDDINVFVGPNESGKSTLVRAIRAAFFERYSSNSAEDLRPWGDSSAAPEIELEFEWQNQHWKLHKRFLNKKRCDLHIGQQHISGAEAEEKLAELLGYQFAGKGASKPEHWGIPGLLWVEQGCIQDIHHSVDHAGHHLKSALSNTLGEVTSTGGDELIAQVESERATLLTKTGQPTGQYKKVIQDCDDYDQKLNELGNKIRDYRSSVDRLGQLQRQRQENDSQKPWLDYRKKAEEAKTALAAVQALQTEQQRDQQALTNCESNLNFCRDQLRDFELRTQQLSERAEQKTKTARALEDCRQLTAQLKQRYEQAAADYQTAKDALSTARQHARRQSLQREHDQLADQLKALQDAHQKALDVQKELQSLRAQFQAQALDENLFTKLKKLHAELNELNIRQQALATRLEFDLDPGKTLTIGADTLSGRGERLLSQPTDVAIPGIGKLRLQPGGTDIADLARKQQRLESDYNGLLQSLNVKKLAEAEARRAENQNLAQHIAHQQTRLEVLAPKGVDALNNDKQLLEQRLQKIAEGLSNLPAPPANAPDEKDAEALLTKAEATLKAAEQADNQHHSDLKLRQRECEAAIAEWEKLHNELQSPERQIRERETLDRLTNLKAEEARLQNDIAQRQLKIDSANPAALQQDFERLSKSADALEKEATQRGVEISTLQIQLEMLGAQGLEETHNGIQQEADHLQRRRTEMQRRAAALDLLFNLLKEKRQALTRQLQAPLQKHLNHYLKLLFPQATLTVDEHLRPQMLTRAQEEGEVISLSYGAREQMGLISRLAYADLLREAGRPTLIILDDALVHCDGERLELMKRVLFDAGGRHQVLLFSCHPERWRGLGVQGRGVGKS